MAITLTTAFINALRQNVNAPNVIIEIALDSGTRKFGLAQGGFSDVAPVLKSVSSLQNKIDPKSGYSTRGQVTFTLTGRDNFKNIIRDEYLKNRRVNVKQGFTASGFAYSDYAAVFTGKISDWSRKGDELTVTVSDDLTEASKKLPVENAAKTQYLSYQNMHPADIMTDILLTRLGIASGYVDSAKFTFERDTWMQGWKFERILTEPKEANDYLNELQIETSSFIVHDGEKVSYKVFAPPVPGQTIEEWTDGFNIMEGSLSCKSGYKDNFFNRVVFYYDYAETGQDKEADYDSAVIAIDSASQGSGQWSETTTKTIKSKWVRTYTHNQPTNVTGVVIYHVSSSNGAGDGHLTFTKATNVLQWTAPGGSAGTAVPVLKDGRYQVFSPDLTKYCRVIVTFASLPAIDKNDTITITGIAGGTLAQTLAQKILSRYRDPVSTIAFEVDINNVAWASAFVKPTDIKDITSDEAFEKGENTWAKERVMITSLRPDFTSGKVGVEAIETRQYKKYGFIAPAGYLNYGSASAPQRKYAFIGDSTNKVNGGTEDGYYIW